MTRISEKQLPNLLDKRLYTTIKGFFDPTQHKPETVMDEFLGSKQRLPSSESVLLHFLALKNQASEVEIRYHKGEYLRFFAQFVHKMKGNSPSRFAPQIIELTDWFFSKSQPSDNKNYRDRLQGLVSAIKDKSLPVSQEKYQDWSKQLQPKRPPKKMRPVAVYAANYCTVLDGRRPKHIDRD